MNNKSSMKLALQIKETKNYHEYVFQNSIKSDIEIVIENKTVKAHKQVLGQQNPVFLDQFLSQSELDKIEIMDLDPNAIEIFINYLYTGQIFEGNITEDLLLVAHKYMDPILKNVCREKLGETLNFKNAAARFLAFLECKEKHLIQKTSLFLANNYNDVKLQLGFKKVLEKPDAITAVFDVFDCCKITVLAEEKNPSRQSLIDSATKSDLTIKVQNESFLAHKNILLTRNTVFKTVISVLPSESEISSSINIPEFNSSIFKIFLTFLYTRDVDEKHISKELMCLAHKYVDSRLEKICEDHLLSTLSEETAIELLELSTSVQSEKLKDEASEFIVDEFKVIQKQAAFQRMKENVSAVDAIFNQFTVKIDDLINTYNCEFLIKVPLTVGSHESSETFYMKNVPWSIFVYWQEAHPKHLGFYLQLGKEVNSKLKVDFILKLISNFDEEHDIVRDFQHAFVPEQANWGNPEFVTLTDLKDKEKMLTRNGMITVKINAKFAE